MTEAKRILVVEDDPVTREIVVRTLAAAGHQVVEAGSGEAALAALDAAGGAIDWLLTDIRLGGETSGYNVGAEFQLRYPNRPVVYTSAAPLRTPALPTRSVCLPKPFDPLVAVEHFRRLDRAIEEAEAAKQRAEEAARAKAEQSTAPAPRPEHDRGAPRLRSMLRGQIIYNNRFSTMDCVVRDISETGARLDLGGEGTLPPQFELYLPLREKRYQAEMMWRRGRECGVRFVG